MSLAGNWSAKLDVPQILGRMCFSPETQQSIGWEFPFAPAAPEQVGTPMGAGD
jgi:hypothetical protein